MQTARSREIEAAIEAARRRARPIPWVPPGLDRQFGPRAESGAVAGAVIETLGPCIAALQLAQLDGAAHLARRLRDHLEHIRDGWPLVLVDDPDIAVPGVRWDRDLAPTS